MDYQPLTLTDKALFDRIFRRQRYENSWLTFTNLWMWHEAYAPEWAQDGDVLFLRVTRENQTYAFPPLLPPDADLAAAMEKLVIDFDRRGLPLEVKGLSPDMVKALEEAAPARFRFTSLRDRWDYLYAATDLRELAGRKYHSKRNHISRFQTTYPNWTYAPLTPELVPACRVNSDIWCEQRQCDLHPDLAFEYRAIQAALENLTKLGLTGGAIFLDGKVEAFTFGEMLNEDTLVIHIEKANGEIPGLYPAINQEFCRRAFPEAVWINREEDLGSEGLRKAKESYYPVRLVEKYAARLADNSEA
ncbi:MAG TPA: phosphatidylglycerol lysyltransferase domain-containing protein [Patescibacteria group bacterium]|nr:phosphatidylglycerol lysyltransferase domain-containing protein [Patescibacteria group bacterium]